MGIYIKKMEMPESCYYCPFADGVWQKDKRCLINGKEMPRDGRDVQQNHINCPLIEIPPHGRLIDVESLTKMHFTESMYDADSKLFVPFVEVASNIFDAPTIIEAEEGE